MIILLKILRWFNMKISDVIGYLWQQIPVRETEKLRTGFEKQMTRKIEYEQKCCNHNFIKMCNKCGKEKK